ncbi:MAG: methylmalonyl-CoA mutase family protein [Desulfobacteraceae bacterium]|jgi:ABC-type multidrug transport system fused ATPase/permease subunit
MAFLILIFMEEVAKYRALRRMWAKTFRERFGVILKRGLQSRIHTQTSGLTLRAEQPLNNIIRTACQSLAAIFGGTNSLYTDPYDEVLGLPTEESHRLALRTQQVLIEETGVADTIDQVYISFAGILALDGVSFGARSGEVFAIIGPKGSGKTTIFNCISRIYTPERGEITLEDIDLLRLKPTRFLK